MGWKVYSIGWEDGAAQRKRADVELPVTTRIGSKSISIWGDLKLSFVTMNDPWGSWGGMKDEPKSMALTDVLSRWRVERWERSETGSERTTDWIRLVSGESRLDLHASCYRDRDAVEFSIRLFWAERAARLKLVIGPVEGLASFQVPGGWVDRGPGGEVPGGQWVSTDRFGFASTGLTNYEINRGRLRATICRSTRFAADEPLEREDLAAEPIADLGEHRLRFVVTRSAQTARLEAARLGNPVAIAVVPAKPGEWARSGSLLSVNPGSLEVLAIQSAAESDDLYLRVLNVGTSKVRGSAIRQGQRIDLGSVAAGEIVTWHIARDSADRCSVYDAGRE
jgi:alpha-mannosidase